MSSAPAGTRGSVGVLISKHRGASGCMGNAEGGDHQRQATHAP